MRKKIYETVHIYSGNVCSVLYKWIMVCTILLSFVPLMTKEVLPVFKATDVACLVIFTLDFILRWISADYKFNCHRAVAFLRYPFRLISVIDLLSIFSLLCPLLGWLDAFAATSIIGAILTGLSIGFFALLVSSVLCIINCFCTLLNGFSE